MRVVGIDFGSKRVGVAVSDGTGTLASPRTVIPRSGDEARDHAEIARIVAEEGAERVVVGWPLSLDGSVGPAARLVQDEVARLAAALDVPVEMYDERFTTVTADAVLLQRKLKSPARRRVVDQVAAAVMLQAWLDRSER